MPRRWLGLGVELNAKLVKLQKIVTFGFLIKTND